MSYHLYANYFDPVFWNILILFKHLLFRFVTVSVSETKFCDRSFKSGRKSNLPCCLFLRARSHWETTNKKKKPYLYHLRNTLFFPYKMLKGVDLMRVTFLPFLFLVGGSQSGGYFKNKYLASNHEKKGKNPVGGGGVLPSKRLLGMCRWMGSHFHNWIDYNGVTFLVELLEWDRTFSTFLG